MKKRLLSVALEVVMAACLVVLAWCKKNVKDENIDEPRFVRIESSYNYEIVYDKETKVVHFNGGEGFSPLYNADGTLQIYEESEDREDDILDFCNFNDCMYCGYCSDKQN